MHCRAYNNAHNLSHLILAGHLAAVRLIVSTFFSCVNGPTGTPPSASLLLAAFFSLPLRPNSFQSHPTQSAYRCALYTNTQGGELRGPVLSPSVSVGNP